MYTTLYLPNKNGKQVETVVPTYIEDIIFRRIKGKDIPRIHAIGPHRFRMVGYNTARPSCGIHADIEKLGKWTSRHCCPIEDIKYHEEQNNYYVEFTLHDPVAQQLEEHGLIRM
jgi:hypothetical protein